MNGETFYTCDACHNKQDGRLSFCEECGYDTLTKEPAAWMFQHDETGRMTICPNDGVNTPKVFAELNPRYALIGPLYTRPQPEACSPGEAAPPPNTPAQHYLAEHNGCASQDWQDGFNACARAKPAAEHCPKCNFTMSGIKHCVNCDQPEYFPDGSDSPIRDEACMTEGDKITAQNEAFDIAESMNVEARGVEFLAPYLPEPAEFHDDVVAEMRDSDPMIPPFSTVTEWADRLQSAHARELAEQQATIELLRDILYEAVGDDAKDWESGDGWPMGRFLVPTLSRDYNKAASEFAAYIAERVYAAAAGA